MAGSLHRHLHAWPLDEQLVVEGSGTFAAITESLAEFP
jgi:hypothetical protein